MSGPVLEARGVHRSFRVSGGFMRASRTLHAVNGVDLAIGRGEVLGLVGESGCGKSTLAKMLLGLLAPSAGEILLDGTPVGSLGRLETARRIQPIFQDPYASLNPRKTVGAIISLPLRVQNGEGGATVRRRVEEMMELVGLPRRLIDSFPGQLSGGQRQRVAIARALVNRPDIVICDEPTSALDVSVQSQILNLLQDLQREFGLTYLLISHDLSVVEHMATRVAVMYLGRIVEERPTEALFDRPGHPYTEALLASVLTPDPSLGIPETHLGASFPNPLDIPSGCSFHPRCPKAIARCRAERPAPVAVRGGQVECLLVEPEAGAGARKQETTG